MKRLSHWFRSLLVPHSHNDYRPHLIRRYGIAAVVLVIIAAQSFFFLFQDGQILGDQAGITVAQLHNRTNDVRKQGNLGALALSDKLSDAAQKKAENMLSVGYWSHDAPDGTTPWQWIEGEGYAYVNAGENLARGFNTIDGIMDAWLDSPSHRANVLNGNYTEVGFAAVNGAMNGEKTTLVVAMYAQPVGTPNAGNVLAGTNESKIESGQSGVLTKLRRGLQSLTPSLVITLILLGITTCVALLAHAYRRRLPKALRQSWYRHHALYKIGIFAIIAVSAVLSYGGGMI
jgi:hypothetical protein